MKYFIKLFAVILFFIGSFDAFSQSAHDYRQLADQLYNNSKFNNAEEAYRKSLEMENTAKAKYNLGNSLFEQERYEEAASQYQTAAQSGISEALRSDAFYNLGNSQFKQEKYDESVQSFKNALKINPKDLDFKRNLKLAQKMLKVQQQQQKQEQQQKESQEKDGDKKEDQEHKDQQNQEEKDQKNKEQKDDQKEEQKEQEEKNKDKKDKEENESKEDDSKKGKEGKEGEGDKEEKMDLSKEDARRLLEIMDQEDRKVQQKLRKGSSRKNNSSKTW